MTMAPGMTRIAPSRPASTNRTAKSVATRVVALMGANRPVAHPAMTGRPAHIASGEAMVLPRAM
ncbi:hypothetical protein [Croceicoccus sp. YJ47]|uniref:hypothetical protein n=1 Tax=Croceicoccus sp. YJ47 TaxID=2798724 RepID=UPI001922BF35|nr:hypothetical protein [Croceicoccus sp. YJ47]QQN74959.1 hypothetical protein JD971_04450 [Croceicoccus sp. YJ47]